MDSITILDGWCVANIETHKRWMVVHKVKKFLLMPSPINRIVLDGEADDTVVLAYAKYELVKTLTEVVH